MQANYSVDGHFGTLQIHAGGTWTYTVKQDDDKVQNLNANDSISEQFAVQVHDGEALSATRFITVTIQGANDAPLATNATNAATEDGSAVTGNVLSNDTDPDDVEIVVAVKADNPDRPGSLSRGAGEVLHWPLRHADNGSRRLLQL